MVDREDLSEITAFIAAMPEEKAKAFFLAFVVSGAVVDGDVLFVDFVKRTHH